MCDILTLIKPTNNAVLDLELVDNLIVEEHPDGIIAGYGSCSVQGCSCSFFNPTTMIPGMMGICQNCNHGIDQHS